MAKRSLIEQLDQAIDAMLGRGPAQTSVDPTLTPLLRIAAELRDLPRQDFKVLSCVRQRATPIRALQDSRNTRLRSSRKF